MRACPPTPEVKRACRACAVCGGRQAEILRRQSFALPEDHPLPAVYDVVCCQGCGFCYADTPAPQAAYDRYYEGFSKYADQRTSTGGGGTPEDARRLSAAAALLAAECPDPAGTSVLDIGCSNGGLLQELQARGFRQLTGVDPSSACVANTARRPGIRALAGTLTALPAELGRYDLVILSHVLEHVADLRGLLAPLAGLLNSGGRLYVEVPDATRYLEFVSAPFQDFNVEHINHFSLASLQALFAAGGFAPVGSGRRDLPVSQGLYYPAVYVFFRRGETALPGPAPDFTLREELRSYIGRSAELMRDIECRVAPLAEPAHGPIIVWGTGQLALKLLVETSLRHARIAAFVDGNPINQGKILRGVPVIAPEGVAQLPPYPVLIATQLHQDEILGVLRRELGLGNPVITL
jgi:SAM-dependent methyltransferase